ncbi:MAG: hypothetical protein WC449_03865 [Candidatus Paceibacterota bacterium]
MTEDLKKLWKKILNRPQEERILLLYALCIIIAIIGGLIYAGIFQTRLKSMNMKEGTSFINWDNAGYQEARPLLDKAKNNAERMGQGVQKINETGKNMEALDNATSSSSTLEALKELQSEIGEQFFETTTNSTNSQPVKNN